MDGEPKEGPALLSAAYTLSKLKTNLLNQVYRKLNLDNEIGADWLSNRGLFKWIRLLKRIDDSKVQKLCGTDIALYIVFLRYSSYFFWIVSIINLFSISLYLTGEPDDKSGMTRTFDIRFLTIEHSSKTHWKVWSIFLICMLLITFFYVLMIIKYQKKYSSIDCSNK